jgi:hypothetical protein
MRRIIYISSTRTAFTPAELEDVLRVSRRNNAAVGVTGLLVAGGRRFLQVLEGADDVVEAVFQRIKLDKRHHAVVMLSHTEIAAGCFDQWSMGYVRLDGERGRGATLPDTVADLLAPITDPSVRGYFEGFAQVHAAA